MGFLSKLFGGKKEAAPAPAEEPISGPDACKKCGRVLQAHAACPFCTARKLGEPMSMESTTVAGNAPVKGFMDMGGVVVASDAARKHKAKGFLYVYQGKNKGESVLLGDRPVSIGRNPEQNVLALDDAGASSRHCEIRPVAGGFQVVDLGSTNGTFVNDVRTPEKMLSNSQVISFGDTRIYVGIV